MSTGWWWGSDSASLLVLGGSLAAWSLRRTSSQSVAGATTLHPSCAASWLARSGLPLPMVLGARQALEPGRGRTAVPTRSTLVALMGAVLVLVTAVVFAGNLRDLESDTSRFGWNSDAVAISGSGYDAFIPPKATPWFRENGVARLRYATTGRVVVDGSGVAAVALAAGPDDLGPTVIEGRAPAGSGEVALGSETMDDLGLEVGDRVELGSRSRSIPATVTGRAVFPLLGGVQTVHTALGQGAWLTGDDARLIDDLPEEGSVYNFALLDLRPGVGRVGPGGGDPVRPTTSRRRASNDVLGVLRPPEVATAVRSTPARSRWPASSWSSPCSCSGSPCRRWCTAGPGTSRCTGCSGSPRARWARRCRGSPCSRWRSASRSGCPSAWLRGGGFGPCSRTRSTSCRARRCRSPRSALRRGPARRDRARRVRPPRAPGREYHPRALVAGRVMCAGTTGRHRVPPLALAAGSGPMSTGSESGGTDGDG